VATLNSGDRRHERGSGVVAPLDLPSWPDKDLGHRRWLGGGQGGWPRLVRIRVRLRRLSLDERLARGADPCSSPELARRAQELCQLKLRCQLGADIERAVCAAGTPAPWLTAAAPLNSASISHCRPSLLGSPRTSAALVRSMPAASRSRGYC
jgi:hypothetical protein